MIFKTPSLDWVKAECWTGVLYSYYVWPKVSAARISAPTNSSPR